MSHLPFTLLAYLFNAVAVTIDKFLLTKHIPNPLVYIFYISLFSLVALLLLPFTSVPTLIVFILASLSTILWTLGLYFLYKALQFGIATRVVPVVGTLVPLVLLMVAFFTKTISTNEVWAASILVLGLVLITLPGWRGQMGLKEIIFEFLSALFFAISYLILRQAYLQENFLTVLVYSRFVLIPVAAIIFIIPNLRKIVLTSQDPKLNLFSKVGLLFITGQILGGSQELLLTFSVSLAEPALVNSLQGTQYIFLFLFGGVLAKKYPQIFKEKVSRLALLGKIAGIIAIGLGLYILAMAQVKVKLINIGITFSPKYARSLGFDPQKAYQDSLDDLRVKYIRLPVYWDEVERQEGQYKFGSLDFYLNEAQKRDLEVILVVGRKQPRWPECYIPDWAENLPKGVHNQKVLELVKNEINYFKKFSVIKVWQLENEPLLNFGDCPKPDLELLKAEVSLVKSQDNRPIMITDSGELSSWFGAMRLSDVFGTTLYRTVWNPIWGHASYPFPPVFYKLKAGLIGYLADTKEKPIIISELQAEPWAPQKKDIQEFLLEEQTKLFPAQKITENVNFAKETSFSQIYLWGVEWWYYMRSQGHPEYWDFAKSLFND